MKKTVLSMMVMLAAVLAVMTGITGCAKNEKSEDNVIVCTSFPVYDFARAVTKDLPVQLVLLLKPGQEVHSYEPTPRDLITIQNARLFLCVGGESDEWVDTLMKGKEFQKVPVVRLMESVSLLEEPEALEGHEEHDEHEDHDHEAVHDDGVHIDEADEHIWTSPANARSMVRTIARSIRENFPELDGSVIESNAEHYCAEITETEEAFRTVVGNAREPFIVMADRFPLVYMAEYYGISYAAAFNGCSSAVEASSATIARLMEIVREKQLTCVYYIELSNHKIADVVAEDTGVASRMLHSVQNVTRDEFENGETWVSLMWHNIEVLKQSLN